MQLRKPTIIKPKETIDGKVNSNKEKQVEDGKN